MLGILAGSGEYSVLFFLIKQVLIFLLQCFFRVATIALSSRRSYDKQGKGRIIEIL